MFSCGNQNAIRTSREARSVLVSRVNIIFIIFLWGKPELVDWKSAVLINTRKIRASSIDGDV